jgi:hypothetical protein
MDADWQIPLAKHEQPLAFNDTCEAVPGGPVTLGFLEGLTIIVALL